VIVPDLSPSDAAGVDHSAICAAAVRQIMPGRGVILPPFSASLPVGVGHPVEPLPDVRSANARRALITRPDGVARCFQVRRYKVEPREAVSTRNLFSKDRVRASLRDEPVPERPYVPLISKPKPFACAAERLAWAGAGPDRAIVRPSGPAKGEAPDTDAGKEMVLIVSVEVAWKDVAHVSIVNIAVENKSR
jgi:hypothetical protein